MLLVDVVSLLLKVVLISTLSSILGIYLPNYCLLSQGNVQPIAPCDVAPVEQNVLQLKGVVGGESFSYLKQEDIRQRMFEEQQEAKQLVRGWQCQ